MRKGYEYSAWQHWVDYAVTGSMYPATAWWNTWKTHSDLQDSCSKEELKKKEQFLSICKILVHVSITVNVSTSGKHSFLPGSKFYLMYT